MPRIDIAVEYVDGRQEVIKVGRPADLIAFADKFNKVAPDGPHVVKEAAWLVHRSTGVTKPFDEWVESLNDVNVAEAVAEENGSEDPTPPPEPPERTSPE